MLGAQELPQSIRMSLLSPMCGRQPVVGDADRHLQPCPSGGPSPVPPLISLLLPGAACTAPDAAFGEINSARAVWLSSPTSFACLACLSFSSLELPDFYTAPYLHLPKASCLTASVMWYSPRWHGLLPCRSLIPIQLVDCFTLCLFVFFIKELFKPKGN